MRAIPALSAVVAILVLSGLPSPQNQVIQSVGGTLVVAVPVQDGLVVCSDKRLYNETTETFRDDFVKIHKVGSNALFVATHTTGFLDKTTDRIEFNVFDITDQYAGRHKLAAGREFWNGLRKELRDQLLQYLSKRKYEDWPATDTRNNNLLFNLVFYTIDGKSIRSYSMSVFYEKAPTPVIYIPDVVSEVVKTPKLSGKGKDVMAYLSTDPIAAHDPLILPFDESRFDVTKTSVADALDFAERLFVLTNSALPQAEVSANHDCALLSYQKGFQWINAHTSPANR